MSFSWQSLTKEAGRFYVLLIKNISLFDELSFKGLSINQGRSFQRLALLKVLTVFHRIGFKVSVTGGRAAAGFLKQFNEYVSI